MWAHYLESLSAFLQLDDGYICKPRCKESDKETVDGWAYLIWLDGCWIGMTERAGLASHVREFDRTYHDGSARQLLLFSSTMKGITKAIKR